MNNRLILFLQLAGVMHLGLLCAGALMPRAVNLRQNIAVLPPFIQKLFWVYYTFIALCLASFGLITFMFAGTLARLSQILSGLDFFCKSLWRFVGDYACGERRKRVGRPRP